MFSGRCQKLEGAGSTQLRSGYVLPGSGFSAALGSSRLVAGVPPVPTGTQNLFISISGISMSVMLFGKGDRRLLFAAATTSSNEARQVVLVCWLGESRRMPVKRLISFNPLQYPLVGGSEEQPDGFFCVRAAVTCACRTRRSFSSAGSK